MIDLGKRNLLGIGISAVDYEYAVAKVIVAARGGRRGRPVQQRIGDLGVPAGPRDGQGQPRRVHRGGIGPAGAAHAGAAVLAGPPADCDSTAYPLSWDAGDTNARSAVARS